MPKFSAAPIPHGGLVLPAVLTWFRAIFRSTHILRQCIDWKDWAATSHIYSLLGDVALAFGAFVYSNHNCTFSKILRRWLFLNIIYLVYWLFSYHSLYRLHAPSPWGFCRTQASGWRRGLNKYLSGRESCPILHSIPTARAQAKHNQHLQHPHLRFRTVYTNNIHNSLTLQNFWSKNKLKTTLLEEIILRDSASLAHPVCLILYKASALPHGCVPITTLPTFSPDFQLDIQLSAIDMVCCCLGVVGVLL